MTRSKPCIIVGGYIGLIQAGGAVWDYIQYPLGFHLMGYDVYYLEDTRMYPVYGSDWNNSMPTIRRLETIMEAFGLGDRWIYRDEVTKRVYGKSLTEYKDICERADILLNVSCANVRREEYDRIPVRILLDSDPMFSPTGKANGASQKQRENWKASMVREPGQDLATSQPDLMILVRYRI